jgi:CDP-diacylglycerol--glycerol-3-phosphate 3-phosphatidyltransferase
MIMVILILANLPALQLITDIVMWIATALTIISLVDYIWKNKNILSDFK